MRTIIVEPKIHALTGPSDLAGQHSEVIFTEESADLGALRSLKRVILVV